MRWTLAQWVATVSLGFLGAASGFAATQDLGQGFLDHGRIAPEKAERGDTSTIAAVPDGTVCGITESSRDVVIYDPRTDSWQTQQSDSSWEVMGRQGDRFFAAGYELQEWNPVKRWLSQKENGPRANPCTLSPCSSPIGDPLDLLALPDGKTIVVAGSSRGSADGSWLLFWNRETRIPIYIGQQAYLGKQCTMSLAALPGNKLIGGSSIIEYYGPRWESDKPPVLFIMDAVTKNVEWHSAFFEDAIEYVDLWTAPDGLVYGIARIKHQEAYQENYERWDPKRYFVFDPVLRKLVYTEALDLPSPPSVSCNGPRSLIPCGDNRLYMLLKKGIAQVDTQTHSFKLCADSPVSISAGGDWVDGRIYFVSEGRLCSYTPLAEPSP